MSNAPRKLPISPGGMLLVAMFGLATATFIVAACSKNGPDAAAPVDPVEGGIIDPNVNPNSGTGAVGDASTGGNSTTPASTNTTAPTTSATHLTPHTEPPTSAPKPPTKAPPRPTNGFPSGPPTHNPDSPPPGRHKV